MESLNLDHQHDLDETQPSTTGQHEHPEVLGISRFSVAPSQGPLQLDPSHSHSFDPPHEIMHEAISTQSIFNHSPVHRRGIQIETHSWLRHEVQGDQDVAIQLARNQRSHQPEHGERAINQNPFSFRPHGDRRLYLGNNNKKMRNDLTQNISSSRTDKKRGIFKNKQSLEISVNCLAFSFIIAILPVLIALMIIHFGAHFSDTSTTLAALGYMAQNLNSDPIMNITLATSKSNCPPHFEPLTLGQWPGIESGCNCPGRIEKGDCQKKEDSLCTDVSDISGVNIDNWGGSVWCVQRAKLDVDYVKKTVCPFGFRECSLGICIKSTLDCPISSVSLANSGSNSQDKLANYDLYIATAREVRAAPLIDIDLTLNDIPCFSPNAMAEGTQQPYILLKFKPGGCDNYGLDDKYSYKIDSNNQEQVLKDNYFPDTIFKLPGYSALLQTTTAVLSGRKRITVTNDDRCLSMDADLVKGASEASKSVQILVTGVSILTLVLHGLIINSVLIAISRQRRDNCCMDLLKGKGPRIWFRCFAYFGMLETISFIIMLSLLFYYHSIIVQSNDYLIELSKLECFTEWQPKAAVFNYNKTLVDCTSIVMTHSFALVIITGITYLPALMLSVCVLKRNI